MNRCLGKKEYVYNPNTVQLVQYMKRTLPPAPRKRRWSDAVGKGNFGIMKNGDIGDCTAAGVGHQIQIWTANNGKIYTPSDDSIVKLYSAVSGYDPNDSSTDIGANEDEMLQYVQDNGLDGHKILGRVQIEPKDHNTVIQAGNCFGGLYIGVQLPETASLQINRKLPWTMVTRRGKGKPGSWGGHCVIIPDWDLDNPIPISCNTWGDEQGMSWGFWDEYVDEVWALVSEDWVNQNTHLCPVGLDIDSLLSDLTAAAV